LAGEDFSKNFSKSELERVDKKWTVWHNKTQTGRKQTVWGNFTCVPQILERECLFFKNDRNFTFTPLLERKLK